MCDNTAVVQLEGSTMLIPKLATRQDPEPVISASQPTKPCPWDPS